MSLSTHLIKAVSLTKLWFRWIQLAVRTEWNAKLQTPPRWRQVVQWCSIKHFYRLQRSCKFLFSFIWNYDTTIFFSNFLVRPEWTILSNVSCQHIVSFAMCIVCDKVFTVLLRRRHACVHTTLTAIKTKWKYYAFFFFWKCQRNALQSPISPPPPRYMNT